MYACEWNPAAVEALELGLQENGVRDKCEIRAGDCRLLAPQVPPSLVLPPPECAPPCPSPLE